MDIIFQSQPCHWRNAKNLVKRSADEEKALPLPSLSTQAPGSPAAVPLSQNINLFQSLRVLQEGEGPEEAALTNCKYYYTNYKK